VGWLGLLSVVVARAVLTFLAALLLWSVTPAVFGWTPRVVLSDSMSPRIRAGDVVLTSSTSGASVRPGRVISFADPDHAGHTLVHRLIGRNPDGTLITRGDANSTPDPTPLKPHEVSGLGRLRVPFVGLPVLWAHRRQWVPLALLTAAIGLAGWLAWRGDNGRADRGRHGGVPPTLTGTAVSLLVLVLAIGDLARAPAYAAFRGTTDSPNSSWTAAPVLIAPNSYVSTVKADAPLLFYRLNEASGTVAADSSGNNRAGAYVGSFSYGFTPQPLPRNAGTAVVGNGSSTCLTSTYSILSTATYTVELWFRTSSAAGGTLAQVGTTGAGATPYGTLAMTSTGTLRYTAFGPSTSQAVTSPATYNDNTWHYVAARISSSGQRLFVDGTQVATANYPAGLYTGPASWRWGCTISGALGSTSAVFSGAMADAAAYNTALTAARIQAHYFAA
jgi:signal peptidase I